MGCNVTIKTPDGVITGKEASRMLPNLKLGFDFNEEDFTASLPQLDAIIAAYDKKHGIQKKVAASRSGSFQASSKTL